MVYIKLTGFLKHRSLCKLAVFEVVLAMYSDIVDVSDISDRDNDLDWLFTEDSWPDDDEDES